jgi:hypothetical protein
VPQGSRRSSGRFADREISSSYQEISRGVMFINMTALSWSARKTALRGSPDGRWLAYVSNESVTLEVYVRSFPGPGGRWQMSTGGGLRPLWSRDGRELLFQTLEARVMADAYTAKGDSFAPARPRTWTEARLRNARLVPDYDLAPDGKRLAAFLAAGANADRSPTHLTFLFNFADELRRKVPVGK